MPLNHCARLSETLGQHCTTDQIRRRRSARTGRVGAVDCVHPVIQSDFTILAAVTEALVSAHNDQLRLLTTEISQKQVVLNELIKFMKADGALQRALTLTDGRLNSRAPGSWNDREVEAADRNKFEKYDSKVGALLRLLRAVANHPLDLVEAVEAVARMGRQKHDPICHLGHLRFPVCREL